MSPDQTPESRLNRLEREMSVIQSEVHSLSREVESLAPVQMSVVRIETKLETVSLEITGLREAIREDRTAAQQRGRELAQELQDMKDTQAADQRANRRQLIIAATGLATTLLLVGGSVVGAILGAG